MKTVKLFFMAALALMTAACSNDDNDIAKQPAKAEGIPFTATISLANDGATTRALAENGTAIEATWAEGEKVALIHNNVSDEMTISSVNEGMATISGTITGSPSNGDAVTIVYPASAVDKYSWPIDAKADLLATQDGTLTGTDGSSIAEKYDLRQGDGTLKVVSGSASLNSNVSLVNQNAIVKFTLNGISIDATHPLVIKENNKTIITVTPATATTSVYVAMPGAASTTYKFFVDNNDNRYLTSGTATIVAGKYYQTTLTMTPRYPLAMTSATVDDIGSLLGSNGIIYATGAAATAASTTAIGVIAYIGTDNFTENGTIVNGSEFAGHGLVLCLKDAASGEVVWSQTSKNEFGNGAMVKDTDGLMRTENVSGYKNTNTLVANADAATNYPAAYYAKNYSGLTAPTGTTGWFLPSAQQWVKILMGLCELDESSIVWNDYIRGVTPKVEAPLTKAGAAGTDYDSMRGIYDFWSSSEMGLYDAVRPSFVNESILITGGSKTWANNSFRVRPILAF